MLSNLRRERILRQLSLYDVRERTGISVSKLSLIEREIDPPNEEDKKRLALALGVRVQDLFPLTPAKDSEEATR
jgi:transcriptional regulator with XRE-family HTH domain